MSAGDTPVAFDIFFLGGRGGGRVLWVGLRLGGFARREGEGWPGETVCECGSGEFAGRTGLTGMKIGGKGWTRL